MPGMPGDRTAGLSSYSHHFQGERFLRNRPSPEPGYGGGQGGVRNDQERQVKALLQRVSLASVSVGDEEVGNIGKGLVVLLGVAAGDTEEDARYLLPKIINLRIFADTEGKFNLSLLDIRGELLLVSQFTLLADARTGRRPSFVEAAPPEQAAALFEYFVGLAQNSGLKVATGRFQAHMMVEIHNDGPVTLMLDSREKRDPGVGNQD
jgi:D-tyrosyl-tRNA(Tyr) deacylase